MRATLRSLLIAGVPALEGRVFEPHAVSATTLKPFGVLRVGEGDAGDAWGGLSTLVEAWPYVARSSFVTVDTLVSQIVATLDNARFTDSATGQQYLIQHEVTAGSDFYDEDWQALTRPVRFRVYSLAFVSGSTYSPDPVAALAAWTAARWPGQVQTDPATWTPADATPGVYWRLAGVRTERLAHWGAWLLADLRAHVLAPTGSTRLVWIRRLTEGVATTRRLGLADGSPLLFLEVAADSEADAFRTGQVRLAARFGVLVPPPTPAPAVIQVPVGDVVTLEAVVGP